MMQAADTQWFVRCRHALQGYSYELFAPQPDSDPIMIAASAHPPVDPVIAIVDVPNNM